MDSIYDRYGDQAFWERIMDQFYARNLADNGLKRFYEGTDVDRIKRMNRAFLATALRPSGEHFPISVKRAHRNMEIFGEDFDKFARNLSLTLNDSSISKPDIEEIMNVISSFRADLVKDE
jgi:hemoglobin